MRDLAALAIVVILCGCLGPAEPPATSPSGPAVPAWAGEAGLVLRGCERHYTFTLVPEATARPFVPEDLSPSGMGTQVQVMLVVMPCSEVTTLDGLSFGAAQIVQASIRLGQVPEPLAGPGLTWYRAFEFTDDVELQAYMAGFGIPVQVATFARQDLGAAWSYDLDVATGGQDFLTLLQLSEGGRALTGNETETDRVLTRTDGGYVWTENNFTVERGYMATGQVIPHGGEALALFVGGVTAFIIPGAFNEGPVVFGGADAADVA